MLFIKFGKKEHLEQLRNGIVHFSTLKTFQKDPTSFRGDKMEGRLYIDPKQPMLVNGLDISSFMKECVISYETNCPEFSFSASILSRKNCHKCTDGLYTVNQEYINEMRQFGECFLIINAFELIEALRTEFSNTGSGFEYHPIVYINKTNYSKIQEYFNNLSSKNRLTGHLFLKDDTNSYRIQNEWRMVLFDFNNHYPADNNGVNVKTCYLTEMPVLDTESLATLRCSEEYLFDEKENSHADT